MSARSIGKEFSNLAIRGLGLAGVAVGFGAFGTISIPAAATAGAAGLVALLLGEESMKSMKAAFADKARRKELAFVTVLTAALGGTLGCTTAYLDHENAVQEAKVKQLPALSPSFVVETKTITRAITAADRVCASHSGETKSINFEGKDYSVRCP